MRSRVYRRRVCFGSIVVRHRVLLLTLFRGKISGAPTALVVIAGDGIPNGFGKIVRLRYFACTSNAKSGSPLARSRVTIVSAKNRQSVQSVITSDDGRFAFHVPAGKYSLGGAKRGFITAFYNQHDHFSSAIVTGADLDTDCWGRSR